jgi:hypothetical protein
LNHCLLGKYKGLVIAGCFFGKRGGFGGVLPFYLQSARTVNAVTFASLSQRELASFSTSLKILLSENRAARKHRLARCPRECGDASRRFMTCSIVRRPDNTLRQFQNVTACVDPAVPRQENKTLADVARRLVHKAEAVTTSAQVG